MIDKAFCIEFGVICIFVLMGYFLGRKISSGFIGILGGLILGVFCWKIAGEKILLLINKKV